MNINETLTQLRGLDTPAERLEFALKTCDWPLPPLVADYVLDAATRRLVTLLRGDTHDTLDIPATLESAQHLESIDQGGTCPDIPGVWYCITHVTQAVDPHYKIRFAPTDGEIAWTLEYRGKFPGTDSDVNFSSIPAPLTSVQVCGLIP